MGPFAFIIQLQVLFIILTFCTQLLLTDCPRLCDCKWKSGKESVICTSANLSSVPLHLDAGTQLLDLTSNNLLAIKQDEFSKAGLLNLQKIYVSKCRLKTLDRYAFRNLINLVELDLSYNALSLVPSHIFGSIPELRELKLTGNPIQKVWNDAFRDVPQLVKLELSDCRIETIEARAFYGLEKSLEWLKIDKNRLTEVKASSFTILQSLHELDLAENPWNCSCKLRPLREWMLVNNVPFGVPPVCRYPNRLSYRSWDKLELDEFACVPEIIAQDPKAHGIEGKNVTLTCHIAGTPEPSVRWMLKNKVIANLSGTPYSNGKKFHVVRLQNNSSDLTILTADVQDAGVYVCTAENKAGRSEASVTLAVSRKPPDSTLSKRVLVASVLAGLFFVLVSCTMALCACTVRKKQAMRWRERSCRRDDNYEKIEMNHKVASNLSVKNDSAQMEGGELRRNGDYRLVPGGETEQELDGNEEGFENGAASGASRKPDGYNERWNSPELPLLDTDDLHIPRRTISGSRDDHRKNSHSMSGTYNHETGFNSSSSVNPHNLQLNLTKEFEDSSLLEYNLSTSVEEEDTDKKYPDLIEGSSSLHKGSLKAISEGNSVSDISDLYCTLPRKGTAKHKTNWRYSSTDSQFPLLEASRYSSSGCNSNGSQASSIRRLSSSNLPNRVNQRSNSYLSLTSSKSHNSPVQETPLLDINCLDNRVTYRRPIVSPEVSPLSTTIANSYDYHAAQLERFLEEYRNLQKELTKMKETCENLGREKTPTKYLDPLLGNARSPISPASESAISKISSVQSPNTPNSNQTLDSSLNNFGTELSKYLLARSSSPNPFNNSGGLNNN